MARTIRTISIFFLLIPMFSQAQITAPGATGSDKTNYPVFGETDSIYIFCADSEDENIAALRVQTDWQGSKTFQWEKFNNGTFDFISSESVETQFSEKRDLADGCYRVTITQAANSLVYRAWVFNNWYVVSGTSPDTVSNCESFRMFGEFTMAELKYYDLSSGVDVPVNKTVYVEWLNGNEYVASVLNPQIDEPPTKDTEYTFRVFDKYGCEGTTKVTYRSIVTKAVFSADPVSGEAPLEVAFTNQSENGDIDQYEWFFFRNLDDIKAESQGSDAEIDSIDVVAFDESPIFTYENSGNYMVKLVSKKISQFHTCVDTAYLDEYIVVDSSFIAVPNVFTPNGDGTNDEFVVKFWSMQSIEISIFNRWGKRIHYWESGNIRGFENTFTETVWDGRLMGGRFASPGVYYYTVVGEGRDGERRRAHGFFHLFRGKD